MTVTGGHSRDRARSYADERLLIALGWHWHPTIGSTVHLRADELPAGRLIVKVSGHSVAVIDGVIHDLSDPSHNGTRRVYGYWTAPASPARTSRGSFPRIPAQRGTLPGLEAARRGTVR